LPAEVLHQLSRRHAWSGGILLRKNWAGVSDGLSRGIHRILPRNGTLGSAPDANFCQRNSVTRGLFDDKIDDRFNTCPSNHYPVVDGDLLPGQISCGAHTSFDSLTILAFNDAPGGLQVLMPNGSWQDMSAKPGQLVVNLGGMMICREKAGPRPFVTSCTSITT
jgi:hypothetical protein